MTNKKTQTMEEFTYLKITDLDHSPANQLVTETLPDRKTFFKCPHHIVANVIKLVGEQIKRQLRKEEPPAIRQAQNDTCKMLQMQQEKLIGMMIELKQQISEIKELYSR